MIFVCNKKNMPTIPIDGVVVNIMRPSPLSNDWGHNPNSAAKYIVNTRSEAIEKYELNFKKMVRLNTKIRSELIYLYRLSKKKHIFLMCACFPLPCHGFVIKSFLDKEVGDEMYVSDTISDLLN